MEVNSDKLNAEYKRLFQLGRNLTDIPARRVGQWQVAHQVQRNDEIKTALVHDERGEVMTNADDEIHDAAAFAASSSGRVVVLGLGLGMVVRLLLARLEVDAIAVIEQSDEVIQLVADSVEHVGDGRVEVIHADAYTDGVVREFMARGADEVFADTFDTADEETWEERRQARRLWEPVAPRLVIWREEQSERLANRRRKRR